ncbi:MAG: alpha/beta hydrolase [Patescibacteria group bacterium]
MAEEFDCLSLIRKKSKRRAGTAILIFPGLIPTYEDLDKEIEMFAKFGDVFAFHYPEDKFDIFKFYERITTTIKQLYYKRVVLVGVSFGGTLAYLLLRYWRKRRLNMGVKCLVALSSPFEPENLTPISQFQLDFGSTVDQYARRVFIWMVRIMRWIWRWPVQWMTIYARDNTFRQTLNALWMAGDVLQRDWLVKKRLLEPPALLLNVRDDVRDKFIRQTNELDFKDIFPRGKILRVMKDHADIGGMSPAAYRQVEEFIRLALDR